MRSGNAARRKAGGGMAGGMVSGVPGTDAVSYTHLDVYKRQENTLTSGHLMPKEIIDLNDYQVDQWPTSPEYEIRQRDETDVYKRQVQDIRPVHTAFCWILRTEDSFSAEIRYFITGLSACLRLLFQHTSNMYTA